MFKTFADNLVSRTDGALKMFDDRTEICDSWNLQWAAFSILVMSWQKCCTKCVNRNKTDFKKFNALESINLYETLYLYLYSKASSNLIKAFISLLTKLQLASLCQRMPVQCLRPCLPLSRPPCLLFPGKPVLACPLLLASLFACHVVSHRLPCTLRSSLPICKSYDPPPPR